MSSGISANRSLNSACHCTKGPSPLTGTPCNPGPGDCTSCGLPICVLGSEAHSGSPWCSVGWLTGVLCLSVTTARGAQSRILARGLGVRLLRCVRALWACGLIRPFRASVLLRVTKPQGVGLSNRGLPRWVVGRGPSRDLAGRTLSGRSVSIAAEAPLRGFAALYVRPFVCLFVGQTGETKPRRGMGVGRDGVVRPSAGGDHGWEGFRGFGVLRG